MKNKCVFMHRIKDKIIYIIGKYLNKVFEIICKAKNDIFTFSIICSSCIGGIIYHRLGLKFLTPTINLWFNQKDFIKFISNLQYYLDQKLNFVESD